jgi:hypothetical protein
MMSAELRKADPAARRKALLLWGAGTLVGALLIAAQGWYRGPLESWILADRGRAAGRAALLLGGAATLLIVPLVAFAVYVWRLGARVIAFREFPPPGQPVIRDTPILRGDDAHRHGRGLRAIAIVMLVAAAALIVMFWRFAVLLRN